MAQRLWAVIFAAALFCLARGQEVIAPPGAPPASLGHMLSELSAAREQTRATPNAGDGWLELWRRRSRAVDQLSALGTNAWPAAPSLLSLSAHPNLEIAVCAARVLGAIQANESPRWSELRLELHGQTNAARAFQFLVTGKDEYDRPFSPHQRRLALDALSAIGSGGRPYLEAVTGLLRSKSEEDRKLWVPLVDALNSLNLRPADVFHTLKEYLRDTNEDVQVRASAALALAKARPGDKEIPVLLRQVLHDDHSQVRAAAARALWQLKASPEEVLPILTPLLSHKLVSVRTAALTGLAEMGAAAQPSKAAIEALLTDTNSAVHLAATVALEKIRAAGGNFDQ